jgi:hypothetical protein
MSYFQRSMVTEMSSGWPSRVLILCESNTLARHRPEGQPSTQSVECSKSSAAFPPKCTRNSETPPGWPERAHRIRTCTKCESTQRSTCPQGKIRCTFSMSVKEQVLQAIQRLPNDIDFRDVTDEIAVLAAVQEAERDIEEGRLISNDEMKSRIAQWSAR